MSGMLGRVLGQQPGAGGFQAGDFALRHIDGAGAARLPQRSRRGECY